MNWQESLMRLSEALLQGLQFQYEVSSQKIMILKKTIRIESPAQPEGDCRVLVKSLHPIPFSFQNVMCEIVYNAFNEIVGQ